MKKRKMIYYDENSFFDLNVVAELSIEPMIEARKALDKCFIVKKSSKSHANHVRTSNSTGGRLF